MSKNNVLTAVDMSKYAFRPEVRRLIDRYQRRRGIAPEAMRILDWGCGRGRSVAWLRGQGFEAYGVDVDEGPMRNAEAYFREKGLDHTGALRLLEDGHKTPFAD